MRRLAFAALLVSTACGAPEPPRLGAAPPRFDTPPPAPAAFVIVTGARTIFVPVDRGREVIEASGRWLLDETAEPARVVWNGADAWDLPECGCACAACVETRTVDPATGRLSAPSAACRCSAGARSEPCPPPDEAPPPDENDCNTGEGAAEGSLAFGVLTMVAWSQEGCEGVNYYDGWSSDEAWAQRPAAPEPPRDAETLCAWDGAFHDSLATTDELLEATCRLEGGEWVEVGEHGECEDCDRSMEQRILRVRRGRIWDLRARIDGVGGGPLVQRTWPATPEECGPIDPCGDPAAFPGIERFDEWWVASDASVALALEDGQASIFRPGSREPARTSAISMPEDTFGGDGILAVFFTADATPLTAAIERAGALRGSRPAMEAAACESDEDCAVTHGCSHFCRAGACLPASAARCAEDDELEPGMRCVERALVPLPLDPADASVEGPRASSALGNRCVEHLRRGALDLAEAACARGLALADRASTRGALYYNLGRIEEARGEPQRAARYYERSLEARPDNEAVLDALGALEAEMDE